MIKLNYIPGILLAMSVIVLGLSSCSKEYLMPSESTVPDTVRFSLDIVPIFNANCNTSGCHTAGGVAPDLSEAVAYSSLLTYGMLDTVNDEASELYLRMNSISKPMPPSGKLPQDDVNLILAWINQGANDN